MDPNGSYWIPLDPLRMWAEWSYWIATCCLARRIPWDPAVPHWIRSECGPKNLIGLSRPAAALLDPKYPLVYGPIAHPQRILWDPTGSNVDAGKWSYSIATARCCLEIPWDPTGSHWIRSECGPKNLIVSSRLAAASIAPRHPLVYGPSGSQRILWDPLDPL